MSKDDRKTIALIEDDAILSQLLSSRLKKQDYEVAIFNDGKTGLAFIQEGNPDLVLLDIALPHMSGMEVLEALHKDNIIPDLPVIIISNSGQPVEIDKAKKLGIRDYLVKVDLTPEEVLEKVAKVFGVSKVQSSSTNTAPVEKSDDRHRPDHTNTGPHVLIVEDDMLLVELLERKFAANNYQIHKTASAGKVREILGSQHIDIILLDVVLPDMDGVTLLKELKADQKYKAIPIIIISNLGQKEEVDRGMREGALDYIVKAETLPGEILERGNYCGNRHE
jgi:DNA-binding response OmpR family regulator